MSEPELDPSPTVAREATHWALSQTGSGVTLTVDTAVPAWEALIRASRSVVRVLFLKPLFSLLMRCRRFGHPVLNLFRMAGRSHATSFSASGTVFNKSKDYSPRSFLFIHPSTIPCLVCAGLFKNFVTKYPPLSR
jgi:hypothetical protein